MLLSVHIEFHALVTECSIFTKQPNQQRRSSSWQEHLLTRYLIISNWRVPKIWYSHLPIRIVPRAQPLRSYWSSLGHRIVKLIVCCSLITSKTSITRTYQKYDVEHMKKVFENRDATALRFLAGHRCAHLPVWSILTSKSSSYASFYGSVLWKNSATKQKPNY